MNPSYLRSDEYNGGIIYNISHGYFDGVGAQNADISYYYGNLMMTDVPHLTEDKPNIFISLACGNDMPMTNLSYGANFSQVLYNGPSAVVITATTTVYPISPRGIYLGEMTFLPLLFDQENNYNLLQAFQAAKKDYYKGFLRNNFLDYAYANLLSYSVYGDGIIKVTN